DGTGFTGFQSGTSTRFKIKETFALKEPGPQEIVILVKTQNTTARKVLKVDYRPPLPRVEFRPPAGPLVSSDEGKGPPNVSLVFEITPRVPGPQGKKFEAQARVNGKALAADRITIDRQALKLTVRFKPEETRSQVQVQLTNKWSDPENSGLVEVRYLRP